MPSRSDCPFQSILIEGVPHKVNKGLVVLKGKTESGWHGTFGWRAEEKTPEMFAKRIMDHLRAGPAASAASAAQISREVAALTQSSGYITPGSTTPRGVSPARSDRSSASAVSGSKKKLSPHSEQSQQPVQHKRTSRSDSRDETMADVPFVTTRSQRRRTG